MVGSSAFLIAIVMTLLLVGGCFATSEEFDPALEGVFNFPAGRALGNYLGERYGGAASWNIGGLFLFMNYVGSDFSYNGPTTVELLAFTTPPSDGHCGVNGTKCLKYSRQFTCFGARPERELLDPASFDRLIELNDTHTAIICSKYEKHPDGNRVTLPRVYIINPQTGEDHFVAQHSQIMSTELVATAVNTSFTVIPASPQQNVTEVNAALIALQGVLYNPWYHRIIYVLNLLTRRFDVTPPRTNSNVTICAFRSISASPTDGVAAVYAGSTFLAAFSIPSNNYVYPAKMLWVVPISPKSRGPSRTVLYAGDWAWDRSKDRQFVVLSATYDNYSPHPTHYHLEVRRSNSGLVSLRVPLDMFVDEFPLLYNATINKGTTMSSGVFEQFIVDPPLSATNIVVVRVTNILFKHANDTDQQYLGCGMMAVDVVNGTLKWAKYHEMPVTPEEAQAYRDGDDVPLACHWLPSNLLSKQLTPPRSPAFERVHWFVVQTKTAYIVEFMDPFFGTSSFSTVVRPDPGWMPITSHVAPKMQGVAVHRLHKGGYSLLSLDFTLKKDKNLIRTVLVDLLNKPVPSSGNNAYTTVLRTMTINPAANTTRLFGGGTFQLLRDVNEDDDDQGMLFVPSYKNTSNGSRAAEGFMYIYNLSAAPIVPTTPSPTGNRSSGSPHNDDDKKTLTPAAKGLIAAVVIFFVGAVVGILIHRRKQQIVAVEDDERAAINTTALTKDNNCV